MSEKISRRDFLKLAGLAGGSFALEACVPSVVRSIESDLFDPTTLVDIPKIVDLHQPIPYNIWQFQTDWKGLLPSNWLDEYKSDYFPYFIPPERKEMSDEDVEFYNYSRANLPFKWQIPKEILQTPGLESINPERIDDLVALKSINDPRERFERVLKLMPPVTFEDVFPREAIESGRSGERSQKLWQRLEQVVEINKAMGVYQMAINDTLTNLQQSEPNSSQIESLERKAEKIKDIKMEFNTKFQDPIMLELTARTSNTHLVINKEVWPNSKYIVPGMSPNYCFGFVGRVIDIMSWVNDQPDSSPLVRPSGEGLYTMRNIEGLENERFNIDNFFKDFELHSHERGWVDVTDWNFEGLLTFCEDHYIVALESSDSGPYHSYIMHKVKEYPNLLMRAELYGAAPSGSLYEPVRPGLDEDSYYSSENHLKLYAQRFDGLNFEF